MTTLDLRLGAIAEAVRKNALLLDIGSDHAYLPIHLAGTGRIARAIATDLRKGPLESADAHIHAAGVGAIVSTRLLDGLAGLEEEVQAWTLSGGITDIVTAGMGGELIVSILEKAPFVRTPPVRLLLQPMTKAEVLRRYLAGAGFSIVEERLVQEGGRIYQILAAEFTGETAASSFTPLEALAGRQNLSRGGPLCHALLCAIEKKTRTALQGKKSAGLLYGEEEALLRELQDHLS